MEKIEQTARTAAIREYLAGVGAPISNVQAHEVLARALGFKNKHVLSSTNSLAGTKRQRAKTLLVEPIVPTSIEIDGKTLKVMQPADHPFTVAEMTAMDWKFDLVIPFLVDQLGDIDEMNDYASKRITGNDCALEDIGFSHVSEVNYGKGCVAYRVTGHVSYPEDFFPEVKEKQEFFFYSGLRSLVKKICVRAAVEVRANGAFFEGAVSFIDKDSLAEFSTYANTEGENNAELNAQKANVVFVAVPKDKDLQGVSFSLNTLKYAELVGENTWRCLGDDYVIQLKFIDA